jgi:hypothetical protein
MRESGTHGKGRRLHEVTMGLLISALIVGKQMEVLFPGSQRVVFKQKLKRKFEL